MGTREEKMKAIDLHRQKAMEFGGPLGHTLARSFQLMSTVVENNPDMSWLDYGIESLQREREFAKTRDTLRDDPIRSLLYDMAESLGKMAEVILEERSNIQLQQTSTTHPPIFVIQNVVQSEQMPVATYVQQDQPCSSTAPQKVSLSNTPEDSAHDDEAVPATAAAAASVATAAPQQAATARADMQPLIRLMRRVKEEVVEEQVHLQQQQRHHHHQQQQKQQTQSVTVTRNGSLLCWDCGRTFKNNRALLTHSFSHRASQINVKVEPQRAPVRASAPPPNSEGGAHQCRLCPKSFPTEMGLHRHGYVHQDKRGNVLCPHENCSASRPSRAHLAYHLRKTHGDKPYECANCDEKYGHVKELNEHIFHTGHKRRRG